MTNSLSDIPPNKILSMLPQMSESEMAQLLEELEILEQMKKKETASERFLPFVTSVWPEFISGRHHKIMADAFERVARGELKRLIVNMPPRHRLALDTEIPTVDGWKTVESVEVGDYVFSPDGKPVLVTGKSDVYEEDLYEVKSIDGHVVKCDGDHLWTVRFGNHKFQTYDTRTLYARELGANLYTSRGGKVLIRNAQPCSEIRPAILPVNREVFYPKRELLVDPYVLGVWIGDGTHHCGVISSPEYDAYVIRSEIERRGYETTNQATKMTFGVLGLKVQLREIGVLCNKHIPIQYLTSSIEQRFDLLRGLMDTDGNVSKTGQCMFSQKSKVIIDQFRELLNSLGIKNTLQTSEAKIGDKSYGLTYRVSFYKKDCCLLPRKNNRTKDPKDKNLSRSIRIRKLNTKGLVRCLEVANEDGLFLIGRGYLTGHNTKSEFASYLLPAWYLGKFPNKKVIQCSHTADLAVGFGRKVRNLLDTDEYKELFPGVGLRADSKAAGRWNTNHNGDYFAIGVGGAVTGKGADLLIIDDPHSEQEATQAESNPEIYDKTYEWFTSGPRQRLQPGGAIVIVMTRWSKKDVCGQILKASAQRGGDEWEVIEFPALFDDDRPLWPEFWSKEALIALRTELPNSKWQAQYQQNPTSDVSAIVKREWWRMWQEDEPPKVEFIIQSWDTAFLKTERSDYSACTTWGVFYKPDDTGDLQANIILLNAFKERMEFPELKQRAMRCYKEWQPDSIIIEAKAAGSPLIFELRRMGVPVQEYTPSKGSDKIARMNAVSDLFASGHVWAPNRSWADEVIEEVASFPSSEHDDLCLVGDSTVLMGDLSEKRLDEVVEGDFVMTPIGPRKVLSSGLTGYKRTIKIVTDSGFVEGTANHPVGTKDGWVNIEQIKPSDAVFALSEKEQSIVLKSAKVITTIDTRNLKSVYNLTVDGAHCFFANGLLVHNCDSTSQALLRFRRGGFIKLDSDYDDDEIRIPRKRAYY